MIRRGFWLAVGATGGIMGYRRAASLGRRLTGTVNTGRSRVNKKGWARETIRFSRDVREGMDLYTARHPGRVGPNLRASADNDEKDER
jgi:hypothetical protein